ncbi:uncharacterized protein LOC130948162 [Arachis stenosperma]|uniref:uncharacterized protein LOC130948162 n=1 Tax=Arachis stenosperma TaxID=217475 RepID=UPI0025AD088E|nr:uncharacterized protein LOC130948162 [Arachis stenosperma]
MKMGGSSSSPVVESAAWFCVVVLVGMIMLGSIRVDDDGGGVVKGEKLGERRVCDEIYVVGEGETLHTISEKCGDPFIVERNPHIHDPDDVFPGLVIKIIQHHHH